MAHHEIQGVSRFRRIPSFYCVHMGFKNPRQTVNGLPVRSRDKVRVRVHGDLNGVVPELILDVGERLAGPDEP